MADLVGRPIMEHIVRQLRSCGFEDISYFCKAYKKKFGKTPAEERNHTDPL